LAHALLEVRSLSVTYPSAAGAVHAVREISLDIFKGETLALVGETGSGKSTLALAVLGLLDQQTMVEAGEILYEGLDIHSLREAKWRSILGSKIGLVFQDARSALNPVLTVEDHLVETLQAHQQLSKRKARTMSSELLEEVGIPQGHGKLYPFELSGGISQRVGIALAICNNPQLLIAFKPRSSTCSCS
jgi:ABC-type glutathione transport system ATPase component